MPRRGRGEGGGGGRGRINGDRWRFNSDGEHSGQCTENVF